MVFVTNTDLCCQFCNKCWYILVVATLTSVYMSVLGLGLASPNPAFTQMVTTFGLAGIVGRFLVECVSVVQYRRQYCNLTNLLLCSLILAVVDNNETSGNDCRMRH